MVVALPIVILVAITAGAIFYTSRARREAAETAAELDRLQQQHESLELPDQADRPAQDDD